MAGMGSLEREFQTWFQTELRGRIAKGLMALRDNMRESLAQHVVKDVYNAYQPNMYERRGENGGLQQQALNATSHADGSPDGTSYRIYINFAPNGNHSMESDWAKEGVYPVHGDDLIGRIENWNPRYSYPPRHKRLPSRPFWRNFVSEMVDDGMAEYFFASAMREQGDDVIEDGAIFREPGDGDY
jgi:hypothetical protein